MRRSRSKKKKEGTKWEEKKRIVPNAILFSTIPDDSADTGARRGTHDNEKQKEPNQYGTRNLHNDPAIAGAQGPAFPPFSGDSGRSKFNSTSSQWLPEIPAGEANK